MTPRPSILGRIAHLRVLRQFRWRAVIIGSISAACVLASLFPERYLVTTSFTPADRDSLGLSGTLGQLGAMNSVFGKQAEVEVALRIGRSVAVRDDVIDNTSLRERLPSEGRVALQRYLDRKVDVRSLRGEIIVIEMLDQDADRASEIITAYQAAVQEELANVSLRQTRYKRNILRQLVQDSAADLAQAQRNYDEFRLRNQYTEPESAISAIASRVPGLEAAIRAKEIELATARQVYTDSNLNVQQLLAELGALQRQLQESSSTAPSERQSVGELVENSRRLYELDRDLDVAKSLYNNYLRYLRGTAVEDLTADANLRVLETPHVDSDRQVWLPPMVVGIALFLLWAAVEIYRLRPPPGMGFRKRKDA